MFGRIVGGLQKTLNLQWTTNKTHKEPDYNFMMIYGPVTTSYTTLQSHPITGTPISFLSAKNAVKVVLSLEKSFTLSLN